MDYQTAHSHHTWASLFLVLHTQPPTLVVYFNQLSGTCCTFFQVKSVENWQKTFKKVKKSTEKDKFGVPPQGVDQLLHVVQLWDKNWKKNCSFSDVFQLNHWKRFKMNKKGWKRLEKVFWPAFRCCKHLKAGWNTQQTLVWAYIW